MKKNKLVKLFNEIYPLSKVNIQNIDKEILLIHSLLLNDYNYFIEICYHKGDDKTKKGYWYKIIDIKNNETIVSYYKMNKNFNEILIDAEITALKYINEKNGRY